MSETRLPLPIALLRRRSLNSRSKNVKDAHDSALFAWEASLRLAVALRPPENLAGLRRPSFAEWARHVSVPEGALEDPGAVQLYELAARVGRGEEAQRKSVKPRELLDVLGAYRNKAHGHALKEAGFYKEAGPLLLEGLEAAWRAEIFLPRAGMLVYVEAVALEGTGGRKGHVLELEGEIASKASPLGLAVPDAVRPHRVYWREGERWKSVHPWLAYDDEKGRVYFFDKLDRKAHYLDFVSGSPPGPEILESVTPDIEELFERGGTPRGADAEPAELERADDPNTFGEFQILGRLGAGGMGEVFLARQTNLDRHVALKMLPPSLAADPIARSRFAREIDALSRCEHPHVVKILSSGTTRGTPWYAMEYVEGADLVAVSRALSDTNDFDSAVSTAYAETRAERTELFPEAPSIESRTPAPTGERPRWKDVTRFFRDAALGVHHLHGRGILHRDLKPGNLMVTAADHRAVVMDLGLAAIESATLSLSHDRSKVLGTLRYMPPEQLQRSLLEVDRRADVYSLGATLYELLTDKPFFDGETEQRLIHQVLKEEPLAPRRVNPSIPQDLELIVRKATDKEPDQRYASAEKLAEDLGAFLESRPIQARPKSFAYQLKMLVRQHKELTAAILLLVVGTFALSLFFLEQSRREVARQTEEIERLSAAELKQTTDPLLVEELIARTERPWPVHGEPMVSYAEWLKETEEVLSRFAAHEAALSYLEEGSTRRSGLEALLKDGEKKQKLRDLIGALAERERLIEKHWPRWEQAGRDLRKDERFEDFELEPVDGLLPLGRNEETGLWEFFFPPSGTVPEWKAVGAEKGETRQGSCTVAVRDSMAIVFVLLPGGSFRMGAQNDDPDARSFDPLAYPKEVPILEIELDPFFLSKFELTQLQWASLGGASTWGDGPGVANPVANVSWFDCQQLLARDGLALPTEAQWEYACRAGTTTVYWSGDTEEDLKRVGWYRDNSGIRAHVGGELPANAFGLHDVHGNVWEWCQDGYGDYSVPANEGDGLREPEGAGSRVYRGGSFLNSAENARAALRGFNRPGYRSDYMGVRPALIPPE